MMIAISSYIWYDFHDTIYHSLNVHTMHACISLSIVYFILACG